jgi:hypothetical protein
VGLYLKSVSVSNVVMYRDAKYMYVQYIALVSCCVGVSCHVFALLLQEALNSLFVGETGKVSPSRSTRYTRVMSVHLLTACTRHALRLPCC